MTTAEMETAVLKVFAANEAEDSEGAWNSFHHSIIAAAGGHPEYADQVCRELRRKKLLTGEGRGKWATYYLTDKGKTQAASQ